MNNGELFHQNVVYIYLLRGRGIVWQHLVPPDESPFDESPSDKSPSDEAPSDESPSDESPVDFIYVWPLFFHQVTQRLIFSVLHCIWRGSQCEKSPAKYTQYQLNTWPISTTLSTAP